ncbi:MAG: nucleoside deaminase [Parvularcula sp.]|jgi:tRNA(Arg) A34 adenosine deaminase TadA|nr:nucleoside deaminase [Parvularcula sp.]
MSDDAAVGHRVWLEKAIELATEKSKAGCGGPFGAVVVRDNTLIAAAWNEVTVAMDPTAHAEVQAIRVACRALGHFQLSDCILYSSCEPCPMCLGAIYWARPKAVYFSATRHQAAAAGFDDAHIYEQIQTPPQTRKIPFHQIALANTTQPFDMWSSLDDKRHY